MAIDPAPQGVWPVTVAGWATLLIAVATIIVLLYDKVAGRSKVMQRMETQLEQLNSEVEDLNATQLVMSNNVKTLNDLIVKLTYQMTGVDGQNGARGDIRLLRHDVNAIQQRNRDKDIEMARMKDAIHMTNSHTLYESEEGARRLHKRRVTDGEPDDIR